MRREASASINVDATEAPAPYRNRIVGSGVVDPRELKPHPRNWRLHEDVQREALAAVLRDVGWVQDIIVNRRSGYVVDGALRLALALARGETEVPVKYVDLDEQEELLVLATLDPIMEMAGAASDTLQELLKDAQSGDSGVTELLATLRVGAGAKPVDLNTEEDGELVVPRDRRPVTCPMCGYQFII